MTQGCTFLIPPPQTRPPGRQTQPSSRFLPMPATTPAERIIVALDGLEPSAALELAAAIPELHGVKVAWSCSPPQARLWCSSCGSRASGCFSI